MVFLLETYGAEFREEFNGWLQGLAAEAEKGDWKTSIDAFELMEELLKSDGSPLKDIVSKSTWDRFYTLSTIGKLRALLVIIKKRCPPWSFRAANNWLPALSAFEIELTVYYMVDHLEKRLVVYLLEYEKV